jgi:hypothetical protein
LNVSADSSALAFIGNPLFAHYISPQLSLAEKALTTEARLEVFSRASVV